MGMKRIIALIVGQILFITASLNIYAQITSVQTTKFSDLTLEISLTKQSFVKLEPIPIIFKLSNNTNQTITGRISLRFTSNYLEILVQNPNGEIKKITPLSLNRVYSVSKDSTIPPGSQGQHTELLKLDLNRHFPTVGNYKLQAVLRGRNEQEAIRTNWLPITITEPQGANFAAYKFLKQGTDVAKLYESPETDQQWNFFEAFAASYPDSPYTNYLRFNLAEHYLWKGEDKKARELLEKLKLGKDFVFSAKVDEYLRKLNTK
jgi:hypothetical protein